MSFDERNLPAQLPRKILKTRNLLAEYAGGIHLKTSGARCHSPALRDMPYCYFHATIHLMANCKNRPANAPLQIPLLEDAGAIQIALLQVVDALGSSRLDPRRAGLLLYAIQIAAQVIPRPTAEKPADMVQTVCADDNGEPVAPERSVCQPGIDCGECGVKDKCLNVTRINFRNVKRMLTSLKNKQDIQEQKDQDTQTTPLSSS
jgi:hypothetical protein